MAVLLGINGPQREFAGGKYQAPAYLVVFWRSLGVAYTLLSAVALTALGYGFAAYRRRKRFMARPGNSAEIISLGRGRMSGLPGTFFDQPGHWLLVEISVTALLTVFPSIVGRSFRDKNIEITASDYAAALAIFLTAYSIFVWFLGRIIFNIYLGISKPRERRWKMVFFSKALSMLLFGAGGLLVLIATISAVAKDRREQVPRDAGHQCGVWIQLALSGLALISGVSMIYNFAQIFYR